MKVIGIWLLVPFFLDLSKMDNSTLSNGTSTEALSPADISALYQGYVGTYILFCNIAILLYSTILNLGDEIEHIWLGRFSLPAFLYYLARYPALAGQSLVILIGLLPAANTQSERVCTILDEVYSVMSILPYIGIQGLLIARAYALYPGNLWVAAGLNLPVVASLVVVIYLSAAYPGCTETVEFSSSFKLLKSAQAISAAVADLFVFIAIIVKLWGVWKLRRITHLRNEGPGIGMTLLFQGLLRFCFVLLMTSAAAVVVVVAPGEISDDISFFQQSMSVVLICQFTLDLRRRNARQIDTVELPKITFNAQGAHSVLLYVHETCIAEFGEQGLLQDSDNHVNSRTAHDEEVGFSNATSANYFW